MTEPGDWRYVYASVPGVAHLAGGIDCQDASAVHLLPASERGPILIMVAADGAGSAIQGGIGAELACRAVLAECAARVLDPTAMEWARGDAEALLASVRAALLRRAAQENRPVREFACTLLGAVVATDRALFLQIGDGAIVIDAGAHYRPVFWPQTGEYANETRFVTDPDATARMESAILTEPVTDIALLSDGLQPLALHYRSQQAHAPFFQPMFQHLSEHPEPGCPDELTLALERFLASPAINQRTHDDKTLILATRRPVPPPASEVEQPEAARPTTPPDALAPDTDALAEPVVGTTEPLEAPRSAAPVALEPDADFATARPTAADGPTGAESEVSFGADATRRPHPINTELPGRDRDGDEAV
jgi:hypothetical protein